MDHLKRNNLIKRGHINHSRRNIGVGWSRIWQVGLQTILKGLLCDFYYVAKPSKEIHRMPAGNIRDTSRHDTRVTTADHQFWFRIRFNTKLWLLQICMLKLVDWRQGNPTIEEPELSPCWKLQTVIIVRRSLRKWPRDGRSRSLRRGPRDGRSRSLRRDHRL